MHICSYVSKFCARFGLKIFFPLLLSANLIGWAWAIYDTLQDRPNLYTGGIIAQILLSCFFAIIALLVILTIRERWAPRVRTSLNRAYSLIQFLEINLIEQGRGSEEQLFKARALLNEALKDLRANRYAGVIRKANRAYHMAVACSINLSLREPLIPSSPSEIIIDNNMMRLVWLNASPVSEFDYYAWAETLKQLRMI